MQYVGNGDYMKNLLSMKMLFSPSLIIHTIEEKRNVK